MLKTLRSSLRRQIIKPTKHFKNSTRTFLSPAYYCNEIWSNRLSSPLLQNVNLDILYHELDQKFQKTRHISAVDVDVFANALTSDLFVDELLDLVHKLRLSAETGNALDSTGHAVIRTLLEHNKVQELLLALNDRLNYGIFLDDYTANILMDSFWKSKNFAAGAFVASQMMLQEDFKHSLTRSLSLLHCYNYLLNRTGEWPKSPKPEEPEEEIKIRVNFIRNPYFDDHFDLEDPEKVLGKTLVSAANGEDSLNLSLRAVGLILWGKEEELLKLIAQNNVKFFKEIIDLVPDENPLKEKLLALDSESADVKTLLEKEVRESVSQTYEKDISRQCELFEEWQNQRIKTLEEQKRKFLIIERLSEVDKLQASLKEKEQRLWFFENQENIELTIEDFVEAAESNQTVEEKKQTVIKEDENYIPPEIRPKRS